jgi:hypothetical protein
MLHKYNHYAMGLGMATLLVSSYVLPVQAGAYRKSQTLSSGTVIPVKLNDTLKSSEAQQGDTFSATVTSANADGVSSGLPIGTKVSGVIRKAEAKDGQNPGMLDLAFNRITLPNGRSYTIAGSPIGLDNKSVTTKNGRLVAKSGRSGPNRLQYVGIGAGAGLLVNVLTHRKGTLMDMLIGAGLGYGAGSLIKGKTTVRDVELKAGTKMGVQLERSVTFTR